MSERLTVYEKAITTERPAELLARMHGFESVERLAESLPPDARVLDVGAGASPFGKEVATLRPDITWTNLDYSYNDPAILAEASEGAPANMAYVAGDATKLGDTYDPETFDAVFSYWLLPHLSIDNPEPAEQAAREIFAATKTGGLMSVGPNTSQKRLPALRASPALQIVKDENLDADSYAQRIVAATKLTGVSRSVQKVANEVATPFFGTSRYTKREGRRPKVFHPETGEYVSLLSRKGVRTAGRLAVALTRYTARQRKNSRQG